MCLGGFEPTVAASELPETRAATGTDVCKFYLKLISLSKNPGTEFERMHTVQLPAAASSH